MKVKEFHNNIQFNIHSTQNTRTLFLSLKGLDLVSTFLNGIGRSLIIITNPSNVVLLVFLRDYVDQYLMPQNAKKFGKLVESND